MRIRSICFLALALILSACSTIQVQTLQVAWVGTYTVAQAERVDAPNSLTGKKSIGYGIKHNVTTTNIVANQNTRMGIGFTFENSSNLQPVAYKTVWRFPKSITNPVTNQAFTEFQVNEVCLPKVICSTGWRFVEPWEMVPGTWTLEIWVKDQMVLTQAFNVIVP